MMTQLRTNFALSICVFLVGSFGVNSPAKAQFGMGGLLGGKKSSSSQGSTRMGPPRMSPANMMPRPGLPRPTMPRTMLSTPGMFPPSPRTMMPSLPIGSGLRARNSPGQDVGRAVVNTTVNSINQSMPSARVITQPAQTAPRKDPNCCQGTPNSMPAQPPSATGTIVVQGNSPTSGQVYYSSSPPVVVAHTPVPSSDTVYSRPTSTPTQSIVEPPSPGKEEDLRSIIEESKQLFRSQRYVEASRVLGRAVEKAPENSDVLQFRGYAFFAAGDFEAASADVYDALQYGNTWNWQAVYDLYKSKGLYEAQLRKLEAARKTSPSLSTHFLLGYQYLVLNHLDRGQKELEAALVAQPEEPLITQLVSVVRDVRSQSREEK